LTIDEAYHKNGHNYSCFVFYWVKYRTKTIWKSWSLSFNVQGVYNAYFKTAWLQHFTVGSESS
jgi:hypothetical protein